MTSAAVATLLVIIIILVLLVKFNRAPDFTIWGGLTLLMLLPVPDPHGSGWVLGVITPAAALSGLANESVATIAALFIVAAGLRETGAFSWIANRFLGSPRSVLDAQNRIVWPTAALSAFLNNTPLVAMLLPVADDWAKKHQISLSKLLLPLSYASILGGACTLIGTSTNLIVNGWLVQETGKGLHMFEMSIVMVPIAILGILFMLFSSRWLLAERRPAFSTDDDAREYTVEMIVEPGSDLVGKTVEEAGLRGLPGLFLIELGRETYTLAAVSGSIQLQGGDRLVFAGIVDSVVDLQKIRGLRPATEQVFKLDEKRHDRMLVEAVLSNTGPLVGRTIKEGRFRTRYNAAVIAVARSGKRIQGKIGNIRLRTGDTLLLDARTGFLAQQRNSRDFFLVSGTSAKAAVHYERAPIAMGILIALVATVSVGFEYVTMVQAAVAAAALTVATRCCRASVARRSIDWEVLLVIAGAIGIGKAMETSGLAEVLGHALRTLFGTDPKLMLVAIFVLAMLLSNIVTAKAGAVLMLPIAMSAAKDLDVSFMPYLIAVMLASSTALATPIGYPTNLMVLGPGGYRFSDYLRLGVPLSLLIMVLAVYMIPLYWPF